MEGVNYDYLDKHKKFRLDSKKLAIIFPVLAIIVAIIVFWWLKLVGITVTGEAFCGMDEHTHSAECYISEVVCGLEEFTGITTEETPTEAQSSVQETTEEETTTKETTTEETTTEEITTEETSEESTSEEASLQEEITEDTSAQESTEETSSETVTEQTQSSTEEVTTEETQIVSETTTIVSHTHSEECYEKILVCTVSEHTHTADCFPDKTSDVETVSDWLSTIENVEITNNITENLIGIAMSQTGYEESINNFEYDSSGDKNGYTRYGEWYGNPYGKWNTMFISFCLHYSNINNVDELKSAGAEAMRLAWLERYAYSSADEYTAERGDLVFMDEDADGVTDTVGIIAFAGKDILQVILGDSNNRVETINIDIGENIIGYGLTSLLYFEKDKETEQESTQPVTEPEETTESRPPLMMMATSPEPIDETGDDESDHKIFKETDLTKFIVDVSFKDDKGNEIPQDATIYIGQSYTIFMEFKEDNEGEEWWQFGHNDQHFLTYQIPGNIECEPFTEWHKIIAKTENGTIEDVGEYFIDENGFLLVTFYDDENGVCYGNRYSDVDFTIEFNAKVNSTQSGNKTDVVFTEELSFNFTMDSTAEMVVRKTHGAYNSKDNTLEYQIRIEATKAVIKDLVVPDDIWENHYALKDTIVVTDLNGNVLDPQPTIGDGRYANTYGFTLTDFPDFAAGEGFIITYKASINDDLLNNDSVGLWNGVYPSGENTNGSSVTGSADDWVVVELNKVEKDGQQDVLTAPDGTLIPVIKWEIEIKKSEKDLAGTVIVDTLGEGLEYYTGQNIVVSNRYDQAGKRLPDTSISWDKVKIDGNTMSFELPEGIRYIITYYTKYEDLPDGEQKQYSNKAKVEIDLHEEEVGGTADVVGFIPRVNKTASGNDGKYVYFNIDVDVPAVIKDWGYFYLTDMAEFWNYNGTQTSLYVTNLPEDMTITAETKNGTITFTPYYAGGPTENTFILVAPAEGNQYHSFNIFFNTSSTNKSLSKWILDEDATLHISYKIPFDATTGTEWTGNLTGDKTVEDVLLENNTLSNSVYFNYTQLISISDTATYKYSPKITKKSVVNDNGVIDYVVTFYNTIPGSQGNNAYLNNGTYSAYFTDTFDPRLEYVPGTLEVTCYSPNNDSLWLNKYAYGGEYIEGNTINIHANQFTYSASNPDALAAGWSDLVYIENLEQHYKRMSDWKNGGGRYVFTYSLKLKDTYLNTTEENKYILDNTAEVKWNTDGSSGPVTDTVEFKTGLLDKQAAQEDNKLNFNIHINRNALDILPGADTLTIEDKMTNNLSVYWDTIKLFYEDENGNWINFDSEASNKKYTVTYDQNSNKLTFTVPDQLHIRVDYTTLVTENGYITVQNEAKLDGRAQVTDTVDAVFKVEQHSGSASASMHDMTLIKQDGDSDVPLPDVTFLLYGPMGDSEATVPEGAESTVLTDNGRKLRYIGSYTTGHDGTVKIESQYLTLGGPYALVEVSPPMGYIKLDKPVYFYFYNADPAGIIQTVTTIISVENYTYSFILPETGGMGTLPLAIVGFALMAFPILYSTIRRKRERRLT